MAITIDTKLIKKLRNETGAPILRVKKVLEEVMGDLPADATPQALQAGEKKAAKILRKEGFEKVAKRASKETSQGLVVTYVHHSGKVAKKTFLCVSVDSD